MTCTGFVLLSSCKLIWTCRVWRVIYVHNNVQTKIARAAWIKMIDPPDQSHFVASSAISYDTFTLDTLRQNLNRWQHLHPATSVIDRFDL